MDAKKDRRTVLITDGRILLLYLLARAKRSAAAVFTGGRDFDVEYFYATTPLRGTKHPRSPAYPISHFFFFFFVRLSPPTPPITFFPNTLQIFERAGYSPAERAFESSELSRPQANHRSPIVI